ncbi:hypothetical protein FFJ24_005755 [Pedobacter sp. KBS0701]|uniref:glycosyltransferase family 32 protein n=1 Tax=Pedobacter sp. KBS0701 TaxID=2578106 RepID=UPI00110E7D69|nr:glycosyltransferase [Pedobacter sp. KBS0701]QDW24355.1 hypothetical protein FFJ24_005755 [Pedobacter sp. KBS0701]
MLPKIIHHIVGPKQNKVVRQCLKSWRMLKTYGYEIKIWNDESILIFVRENYPFALQPILEARNHAEVADIARYLIIYHYGGHYYDWDIQLLDIPLFLGLSEKNRDGYLLEDPIDGSIASEAFCAKKNESYLYNVVEDITEIYDKGIRDSLQTFSYSGPYRMRDTLQKNKNSSQSVIPVKDVFLYDYREIKEMPNRIDSKPMIHYWLHSWL